MRLNHVTIVVEDVERAAAFYIRLGLTQIVANYPNYARLLAPEGNTTLSLQRREGTPSRSEASIHFEVDDVDQTIGKLEQEGVSVANLPVDQPYLWREAMLLDPDGNRIFIYRAGDNRINPPWRLGGEA